jgi:hypothetical protein
MLKEKHAGLGAEMRERIYFVDTTAALDKTGSKIGILSRNR